MGNLAQDFGLFVRSAHELFVAADPETLIQSATLGAMLAVMFWVGFTPQDEGEAL